MTMHQAVNQALCCSAGKSYLNACLLRRSVTSDSLQPNGLQPARLLSPWNSPGKNTGVGSQFSSPGDLPNPGFKHRSPALQADSSSSEPPGKPRNVGVGCLSLLQGIFLTQESSRGLLHYRQILYQLSHQGSPQFIPP